MQVPGRAGYSIIGDESIEFYRTPRDFLDKRRRNYGNVFLGRILNKPTVFMTSNRAVQELLHGMLQCYELESLSANFVTCACVPTAKPSSANFVTCAYVPAAKWNTTAYDHSHEFHLGPSRPCVLFIQWTTMAEAQHAVRY